MKLNRGFSGGTKNRATPSKVKKIKEEQDVDREEEQYNNTLHELKEEGIVPFGNDNVDDDYLQLPVFLTEESSKELGNYFNTFTMQRMYVRTILGRLRAHIRDLESDLDDIRATLYPTLPVKMSIKEKEVALLSSHKARQIIEKQRGYQAKLDIVKNYMDSLEDGIHNISREITRRGKDWDDSNRGQNI